LDFRGKEGQGKWGGNERGREEGRKGRHLGVARYFAWRRPKNGGAL